VKVPVGPDSGKSNHYASGSGCYRSYAILPVYRANCSINGHYYGKVVWPSGNTSATGTSSTPTQPFININVAGVHNFLDKPDSTQVAKVLAHTSLLPFIRNHRPPIVSQTPWCQFRTPGPVQATPEWHRRCIVMVWTWCYCRHVLLPQRQVHWLLLIPFKYWVTETTIYGCVSDSCTGCGSYKSKAAKA
jgi:hypothetical protein